METDCDYEEEFVSDYEKRVSGVVVGVRLTPVSELRAELEATGLCGVNLEGAVCVAYLDPDAAELAAELMAEDPLEISFDVYDAEVSVARKVLGESSTPRTLSGIRSSLVCGEALLLGAFPPDAPEDLVWQIEWEALR